MPRKALEERLALLEAKLRAREEVFCIINPWFPHGNENLTGDPDAEGWAWISPYRRVCFVSGTKDAIHAHLAELRKDPQYQKPWVSDWKPKVAPGTHETTSNKEDENKHDA